jgi:signal transduction histidine kinase
MSTHTETAPVVSILHGDGAIRQALKSLIGTIGLRAETYESAGEFLGSSCAFVPSCLVLDAVLPDRCGLELQEQLAGSRPDLAIVFVAANADLATGVRAMKTGAVDFLTVPLDEAAVLCAIEQAIKRSSGALTHVAHLRTQGIKPVGASRRFKRGGSSVDRRADTVTNLQMLAASIAHEVKQPLAGILTNASTCLLVLSGQQPDIDSARETARRTIRDVDRATEVINRLRTLFATGSHAVETMDLNETVLEAVEHSQSDLDGARVRLQCHLAEDLAPLRGDRIQLQQVVSNLVRNAIEAMSGVHDRPRELTIVTWHDELAR